MTLRWPLRIAAVASIAFLLIPPFVRGWTQVATDFPNYYTAGLLARHGAPLRNFYDWTWFQRQINYAGWGKQLGSYIPHPPLAMLPVLPLTWLPPMTAKRVWLAMNLLFLGATIWMLAKLTRLPPSGLTLLACAGYGSLGGNFELGQMYVFLLFLLTWSFWLLFRGRELSAGLVLGSIFLLKLYAGPFGLYFLWKRRWRAAAGMTAAGLALAVVSIAIFGWRDNLYFVTHVLPRAAAGETNDPYAPGLATPLSFLRHALMMDPDVNPHPLANVPALMFFLQPLVMLSVLVFCVIALPRDTTDRRELAWFVVMMMLAATNRAFYVGVLLLLPIALLLEHATVRKRIAWIAAYFAMTIPWPESWDWLYPTMWLLIAVYVILGIDYWRKLQPKIAILAGFVIVCASFINAQRRMVSFHREPKHRLLVEKDAVYSASPTVSSKGVVYESIAQERYLLNRWHDGKLEVFPFDGDAFHPTAPRSGSPIYFELVANGHSRIVSTPTMSDPLKPAISPAGDKLAYISNGRIYIAPSTIIDTRGPVTDVAWFPDGHRLAYVVAEKIFATSPTVLLTSGSQPAVSPDGLELAYVKNAQVWVQNLTKGAARQITEGLCNNYSPAWALDSTVIIFASDCQRGLGLPVLYQTDQIDLFQTRTRP
jgi:hypothetical protein